jgi:hypothetical protein
MKRFVLAALAALLFAAPAVAQNNFATPGGATAMGQVQMCLNSAGNAVACSFTAITASATGTTAATTVTLPATSTTTTYICGFDIGSTATAAAAGNATVTGPVSGTLNFEMGTGLSPAVVHTTQNFNPCVPASAVNTSIAVVSAAPGAGGVISVTAWGYQK